MNKFEIGDWVVFCFIVIVSFGLGGITAYSTLTEEVVKQVVQRYPFTQEALETYPAEKCKGIIVGNVECLDYSTLGKGVRACSESITQSEGSVIEEVKRKCPLVENPAEKEPEACAPINGVLYCGTEDEVRTKVYQNQKAYLEKNKKPLEYPLESEGHLNLGFQGAVSRLKTPDGDYICTDGFVLCVKDEKLKELYQLLKSKYE